MTNPNEQTLNCEDKFLDELESFFREIMSEITETHRYNLKQELKSKLRKAMKEHAIEFANFILDQPHEFGKTLGELYNIFNLNKESKTKTEK